jgi:hypothetical protein
MKIKFEYEFSVNLPEFTGIISCMKEVEYQNEAEIPILYDKNRVRAMNEFIANWSVKGKYSNNCNL